MSRLTQIVPLSHAYLADVLAEGDLAVDLTAGNGHDTLFLSRAVGGTGSVLAFDLQPQALESTAARLAGAGIDSHVLKAAPADNSAGTYLVNASHDQLFRYLARSPKGVIANLGYLPGGDKAVITRPESTLSALQQAADLLAAGGRLAVVVYAGHPGGEEEGERVDAWFRRLDPSAWDVLRIATVNRAGSPRLLIAERRRK